jgi:hypothetical protein
MLNKKMRRVALCIVVLILAAGAAACGSGARTASDGAYEPRWNGAQGGGASPGATPSAVPGMVQPQMLTVGESIERAGRLVLAEHDSPDSAYGSTNERTRHIIRRVTFELESEYFHSAVQSLRGIPISFDGYIESETLTTTHSPRLTLVMRVPSANFELALEAIEGVDGIEIMHRHQSAEDVTDQFYDLAAGLETRRIEEERVLALIEEADAIAERLALESRLSNVRQIIESYLSQLDRMAGQIAYSTITVTLLCTEREEPAAAPTLGERIGGAFGDSVDGTVGALQGIIIFLVSVALPAALLAIFGGLVWLVVRKVRRKLA